MIKEREKRISRVEMKERERGNRGGRERWPLQRPLFLEIDTIMPVDWSWSLSEHVIAKPDRSATVRGPLSVCFRTSCTDTGPNTSSHTHTPPSTSTAGCTDRLHEYLSEQFKMSTHIRLAFPPPSIFTRIAGLAAIPLSS